VSNILTLLAFAGFLFWLNPLLAAVSLSIYPAAMLLIPFLQKRANIANKARVDQSRVFSGRIAEAISGIHEIHGNGTYRIETRKFNKMVERLRKIRVTWAVSLWGEITNLFTSLGPSSCSSWASTTIKGIELAPGGIPVGPGETLALEGLIEFYQVTRR
jgi:ABC-type multidrug transport system fused ATPase/permease subunit